MQKSRAKENSNFERDKMRSDRGDNLLEELSPSPHVFPSLFLLRFNLIFQGRGFEEKVGEGKKIQKKLLITFFELPEGADFKKCRNNFEYFSLKALRARWVGEAKLSSIR